ncbi:MAG: nucleotidyltransferase family protein [Verrucomicrobiota bacterium]
MTKIQAHEVRKSKHREHIAELCRRYNVKRMAIFGSAATGGLSDTSDIDIAVVFDRTGFEGSFDQYMGLKEELEQLYGRPVDLVTADKIRNAVFAQEVEKTQEVIYAA